jgi:integrase/recombinase XerD
LDIPTPEQLANPDDLFALIWRVRQAFLKAGLTKRTVKHYPAEGMTVILRRHIEQGLSHYSEPMATEMVAEIRHDTHYYIHLIPDLFEKMTGVEYSESEHLLDH